MSSIFLGALYIVVGGSVIIMIAKLMIAFIMEVVSWFDPQNWVKD